MIQRLPFGAEGGAKMPACLRSRLRFSCRGMLIGVALVFGCVDAARANVLHDIDDFFSGNAPEVTSSRQCNSYAVAAVVFANRAREQKCPLTGHRYGTDEKGHYWWCMGVSVETMRAESEARRLQTDTCDDYQAFCEAYGSYASRDAYDNRLYNCGFSGPKWGEDPEGHRSYCLFEKIVQTDRGETLWKNNWPDSETRSRSEAVYQCKAKHSVKKQQFCKSYATQAVASAKTFKEKNCDRSQNSSGRWGTDYALHFSWCIGHGYFKAGNSETEIRNAAVAACLAPLKSVGTTLTGGGKKPPSGMVKSLDEFIKVAPSTPPNKPTPKGNAGPSSSGVYLSKPINSNSAMDRLTPGGGASGGGSSGISTSRPGPRPSVGGSSGISTSKPISPPSGGSGSGISTSRPIPPPSGSSSSGVYLSR